MSCLKIFYVLCAVIVMISAYPVMDPYHGTGSDSIDPAPHPGSGPQPPEPVPPEPPHLSRRPRPPGFAPIGPINPGGPIDTWLPGPRGPMGGPIGHGPIIIPLAPVVPVFPWNPGTLYISPFSPRNPRSPKESDS
ncbi:PREDICTED: homeobox protein ESX1-like [Amphimedon queenslandica]|nr:PREDICTED: homeobox protein ESX1-like [Amphimedon queenslandica]|eukprot:XP_011404713.1 PREDICTED: homeobox protein ESX1-like [Amphimedon queenslandica]